MAVASPERLGPYPGCSGDQPLPAGGVALRAQRLPSTAVRKSRTARLNWSGSSRLLVCPLWGKTTNPDLGMWRFMKIAGSTQGSSSSPMMIKVGTFQASQLFLQGEDSGAGQHNMDESESGASGRVGG